MLLESRTPTADEECWREATHTVPGTPLGTVAMCDECYAEFVSDDTSTEADVTNAWYKAYAFFGEIASRLWPARRLIGGLPKGTTPRAEEK